MRIILGLLFVALVVVATGYSFQQLVLKPAASLPTSIPAPVTYGTTTPATMAAHTAVPVANVSGSPIPFANAPSLPTPPKPTAGELIALLEHGSDDHAAIAVRELVAIGEPALAPLVEFQQRWRKTMTTLQTAEAELSAAGESADLSASIRKANQMAGRAGVAIREINKQRAEQAVKVLKLDAPPPIPAAENPPPPPPPIPAAMNW